MLIWGRPTARAWTCRPKRLAAETFDARTALDSGLITHVVEPDQLDHAVAHLVAGLTSCERQGLEATKRLLNSDALMYLEDQVDDMVALSAELFSSDVARRHLAPFAH